MNNETIITIVAFIVIAVGSYFYTHSKKIQQTVEESKEDILKDFLQIFIVIANDSIDVLKINKINISEDEYKNLLAKRILDIFNREVPIDTVIFTDEEKIAFIKQYVLSTDTVLEKLKEYFNKEEKTNTVATEIDKGATEIISGTEASSIINDTTKTNMTDSINNFYE